MYDFVPAYGVGFPQCRIKSPFGLKTKTGIFPRLKQYRLSFESTATLVASCMKMPCGTLKCSGHGSYFGFGFACNLFKELIP